MGKAKVLVIGFKGLAAEAVKNIVLAGVGSVTILENEKVKVVDIGANFFLSKEDVGKNRVSAAYGNVSELNPMMRVVVDDSNPQEKPLEFFEPFDVICLTDSNKTMIKKLPEEATQDGYLSSLSIIAQDFRQKKEFEAKWKVFTLYILFMFSLHHVILPLP